MGGCGLLQNISCIASSRVSGSISGEKKKKIVHSRNRLLKNSFSVVCIDYSKMRYVGFYIHVLKSYVHEDAILTNSIKCVSCTFSVFPPQNLNIGKEVVIVD